MIKILIGMILGGMLAYASLLLLGYSPSKDSSLPSTELDALIREFPNKTLIYWTEEASCELYLYGDLALLRRMNRKEFEPRKEFDLTEARAIWDQFQKLPGLQEFKNPDPDTVRSRSTHNVVSIMDAPGRLGPTSSYSIPKDEGREDYRIWRELIEAAIRKHSSEHVVGGNGG